MSFHVLFKYTKVLEFERTLKLVWCVEILDCRWSVQFLFLALVLVKQRCLWYMAREHWLCPSAQRSRACVLKQYNAGNILVSKSLLFRFIILFKSWGRIGRWFSSSIHTCFFPFEFLHHHTIYQMSTWSSSTICFQFLVITK